MRIIKLMLCIFIAIIPLPGYAAGGECVPEGNETAATATPADFFDSFTNVVCPADLYDYYVVQVPEGITLTGYICMEALEAPGTSMRISNADGVIYISGTTYKEGILIFKIPEGPLPAGPYYVRIGFWSEYATEHHYTLTFNIENLDDITAACPPWGMERCDARNTGRSKFPGPGDEFVESATIKLISLSKNFQYTTTPETAKEFYSLRTGPDGWVYFSFYDTQNPLPGAQNIGSVFGYNIQTNQVWPETQPCWHNRFSNPLAICRLPPYTGCKYPVYVTYMREHILPMKLDGSAALCTEGVKPEAINYEFTGPPDLLSVGSRVCIGSPVKAGGYDMDAFQIFDGLTWQPIGVSYPTQFKILHVCQDELGNIWCRSKRESLLKFNPDGKHAWEDTTACSTLKGGGHPPYFMWPILGDDGLVWCASVFEDPGTGDIHKYYGGLFKVFWTIPDDCIQLKSGSYGGGKVVVSACYGGDSRLYIATRDGAVSCYKNWDEKVWETNDFDKLKAVKVPVYKTEAMAPIPGYKSSIGDDGGASTGPPNFDITDMILDKDNFIYIVRTFEGKTTADRRCKLSVLDPGTGEVLASMPLDVPGTLGQKSWLAIASEKRLVWMNNAGWLKIFTPKLRMIKDIKMEIKRGD